MGENEIQSFIHSEKEVIRKEKMKTEEKFLRRNCEVKDKDGNQYQIYIRQNKNISNDFSCGLIRILSDGQAMNLMRCNGSSHNHKNFLENENLGYVFHVHIATERYITAGKKSDGYAISTKKYTCLSEAYQYLLESCHITDDHLEETLLTEEDVWK